MTMTLGVVPERRRHAAESPSRRLKGRSRVGAYQHVLFVTLVPDEAVQMPDPMLGTG